jgi:hypothetical protein
VVARREPERGRGTGKRDFDGLGRFERPVPVPVEVAISVSVGIEVEIDLTPVGSVRFGSFILSELRPQVDNTTSKPSSSVYSWQTPSYLVSINL